MTLRTHSLIFAVALVLTLTACGGGGSTETTRSEVQDTSSGQSDDTGSTEPPAVPRTTVAVTTSPALSTTIRPAASGGAADLDPGLVESIVINPIGAGPGGCYGEGEGPSIFIRDAEGMDTRDGFEVCIFGFDTSLPIDAELVLPDGSSFTAQIESATTEDGEGYFTFVEVLADYPLGESRITARQGDLFVVEPFRVVPVTAPHLAVLPVLGVPAHVQGLWPRLGGTRDNTFRISLAGFPPGETVRLDFFVATEGQIALSSVKHVRSVDVDVDETGGAVYPFELRPGDPDGAYCVAADDRWPHQFLSHSDGLICEQNGFAVGWWPIGG